MEQNENLKSMLAQSNELLKKIEQIGNAADRISEEKKAIEEASIELKSLCGATKEIINQTRKLNETFEKMVVAKICDRLCEFENKLDSTTKKSTIMFLVSLILFIITFIMKFVL